MASELRKIFAAGRPLVEQSLDLAEEIAALRDMASDTGFDWSRIKALLKAQIQDERDESGDGKRVRDLLKKADATTAYADVLGLGQIITQEKNISESHDPETGEIAPAVLPRTRAAAQRFVDSVAKNPGDSVSIEAGGRRTTISNVEGGKVVKSEAVAEPEPSKPHILTPAERDPLWEFEHRGMIDAASGQHRVPTDLAGEHLAAWQKGHDEKMAAIRERAA